LASYAAGYERWLVERGYGSEAVPKRVWQLAHLSRWLDQEGLSADRLTAERVEQFLAARRAAGYVTWVSSLSLRLPLEYLRELGVVAASGAQISAGPVDRLLEDYASYLIRERGLAASTIDGYERVARVFLEDRERRRGGLELDQLSTGDVSAFLAFECPRRSISGARGVVAKLRPLLVYLHVTGLISTPLRWAVPGVADLQGRSLPRALEPAAVAGLLASCDRRRTAGRRDYAILLLLARLGLRGGEVAAMRLEDVDWRAGEILVRGKGGRRDLLPLPTDVGEALASYLQYRPRTDCRAVFLRVLAPAGPLNTRAVLKVVNAACRRAGVPQAGSHQLRHTAATVMLRAGGSLPEIAQVLRHQQLKTTAVYSKVDHAALRTLALPWPEGGAA
jgi:site-specific recombinase XerD